ncbi:hypothetical protein SPIROBIBN47_90050 [uncultured spirochete]|jgi:hypothetical protein|uniref:C2H2-type domain-containing protein n=1 Tax=uncultured spirochete TaxID=156406 RepID=A0A3P3XM14_9SPIR|nr:hypothetical protein [Rectinema subterraneum]SLM15982.1 hypothetical protein SPIROBIBN47_90050 [uncultured spirochete]
MNSSILFLSFIIIIIIVFVILLLVKNRNRKKQYVIPSSNISHTREAEDLQLDPASSYSASTKTIVKQDIPELIEIKNSPSPVDSQMIDESSINDNKTMENLVNPRLESSIYFTSIYFIRNDSQKTRKHTLEPIKRGGRPRDPNRDPKYLSLRQTLNYIAKPEIVCWEKGSEWKVGVEIPDEILANQDISILQNGIYLDRDSNIDNCWNLAAISGEIIIQWSNNEINNKIVITNENTYLIFRLVGEDQKRGYLVSNPSMGSYLIIAPEIWEYSNISTVNRIALPEPSSLVGYLAHFCEFKADKENSVAFKTSENKIITIKPVKPKFELVGNSLEDSSENIGPLFGDSMPQIKAITKNTWNDISVIIIGEEGRAKKRWRKEFIPDLSQNPQYIPDSFYEKGSGWYYVRIYNKENELVESMNFRYIELLKKINIPKHLHPAQNDGYQTAKIELIHSPGFVIKSANRRDNIQIEQESSEKTIIKIPADPDYDNSHWLVEIDNNKFIPLTISLKRIWWALGEENKTPLEWIDKAILLQRSDFTALSNKALWIRCPQDFKSKSISISMGENSRDRHYKISDSLAMIPIREFSDVTELMLQNNLEIFASLPQDNIRIKICEVLRKLQCKFCDFTSLNEQDIIAHAIANHLDQMFIPLNYDELKANDPNLPHRIYQCIYCGFYVTSDDIENPTSKIIHHINNDCKKAPRNDGPPRTDFKIISNVDEIRENIIAELPNIEKCYFCGKTFERATDNKKKTHLKECHMSLLYKLL